jgi:hypothetical protein
MTMIDFAITSGDEPVSISGLLWRSTSCEAKGDGLKRTTDGIEIGRKNTLSGH